ncbi:MAG TPA: hypothetical protein VE172_12940 [Stackebrandtia sp.]|nr:hypothetical protein [Stackebrandtia sp.]HZE39707.1 hypothetical protein [Stackebrandtia sp.]
MAASLTIELASHIIFGLSAVTLIVVTAVRLGRTANTELSDSTPQPISTM